MQLEGLGKLKKPSDLIGILTRDLPAYSIVPQQVYIKVLITTVHFCRDCREAFAEYILVLSL
jgi:hypothetical protein